MIASLAEARVTIVGLGLMGGSLAAALSAAGACRQVVGVARRPVTLATAQALRFIQRGATTVQVGAREADLVVLATPVRDILARLETIGPSLKPGCVLLDVGSTKAAICRAMETLPPHVQPLGGHPMCGKETSGLTMAEPDLFRDRIFVLTPLARTSPEALALAQQLVSAVGARPLLLVPERHDALVAAVSHLPYLLAVTLMRTAEATAAVDDLVWRLAASGFRDTSRVAASSVPVMLDILATNREPILAALGRARGALDELTHLLDTCDWAALETLLGAARERRQEVFP